MLLHIFRLEAKPPPLAKKNGTARAASSQRQAEDIIGKESGRHPITDRKIAATVLHSS